jgi:hypothetical protein
VRYGLRFLRHVGNFLHHEVHGLYDSMSSWLVTALHLGAALDDLFSLSSNISLMCILGEVWLF